MKNAPICPCEGFIHPKVPFNPARVSRLAYRVGDYDSFRHSLLMGRAEPGLGVWRPGGNQDLGVMLCEFWAYLADILTFYNEEFVNEQYLSTVTVEENLRRLVRQLGYRPSPGIGAVGTLAAIIRQPGKVKVPVGFSILSKPGPGHPPQSFEVDKESFLTGVSLVEVDPPAEQSNPGSILLAGEITALVPGDKFLLWPVQSSNVFTGAWVTLQSVQKEKSPRGVRNTRLFFSEEIPGLAEAAPLRFLRPSQSMGLWPYSKATSVATASDAHLAGIAREARPGTPLVFEADGSSEITRVRQNSEQISTPSATNLDDMPDTVTNIPIPHTKLSFEAISQLALNTSRNAVRVLFDFRDAGRVIPTPAIAVTGPSTTVHPVGDANLPAVEFNQRLFITGADETGSFAVAKSQGLKSLDTAGLAGSVPAPNRALFHLLSVSRGKTVDGEILGSGDATGIGQEFTLQKSPLTYLPSSDASVPEPYRSTLRVWVDGIQWHEVRSFFEQGPKARVFVTREDEDRNTVVMFGDGVEGARLPSGSSNVVASYRYGSGAAVPEAGSLTVLGQSLPGLVAVKNPVQPSGGADPAAPSTLRRLAPQAVLTFGRAVSSADYETMAAQAPGVARAKAYWSFDSKKQRPSVRLYVGDGEGAVDAALRSLTKAVDPNRPLTVLPAARRSIRLELIAGIHPDFAPAPVLENLTKALLDEDIGLFGVRQTRIGQVLFRSTIYSTCLSIAGVTAIHNLAVYLSAGESFQPATSYRIDAGEGNYFSHAVDDLVLSWEARR